MDLKTIEKGIIIVDIMVTFIVITLHLWGIIVFPYEGNFIFRIFLLVFILISASMHLFYLLNFNLDYAKAIKYLLSVLIVVIVGSVIFMDVTQGRLSDAKLETTCKFFSIFFVFSVLTFGGEKHYEDIKKAIYDSHKSRQFRDPLYPFPTT